MATKPTTLTFLGAAGTVTGSKYLLTIGSRRVLVDSGMFQGEKKWRLMNWEEFPVDPASISDLVLTHAHMDHVGYLPALTRAGFDGPIWCTEGTRQLAEIVLRDGAKLQEQEAEDANRGGYSKHDPALPLYTTEDVEAMLDQFVSLEYDTEFELTGNERDGFTAKMAIHPDQVAIINAVFTPSPEAVARSKAVVEAFRAAGDPGVVAIDGKMYDRPHLRLAERLLARAGAQA